MSIAITLHLFGTIIWVGGMFFAHMALRPAAEQTLEPAQRLPLLKAALARFFGWVWLAIAAILGSGYWIFFVLWNGQAGLHVQIMQGVGLLMTALFCYIYFVPYRGMGQALAAGDLPAAAARMARIRLIVGINLLLGILTSAIGVGRPF